MDAATLVYKRKCFVRGCPSKNEPGIIRYFKFPNILSHTYKNTVEASGHTFCCIESEKPKQKYICSEHYSNDDVQALRPTDVYPQYNLEFREPNYYSKKYCICPSDIPSTSYSNLNSGPTTSHSHLVELMPIISPAPQSPTSVDFEPILFRDICEPRTYPRRKRPHHSPTLSDSAIEEFGEMNKIVEVAEDPTVEMIRNVENENHKLKSTVYKLSNENESQKKAIKRLRAQLKTRSATIVCLKRANSIGLGELIDTAEQSNANAKVFAKILLHLRSPYGVFTKAEQELCHNLFFRSHSLYNYLRKQLGLRNNNNNTNLFTVEYTYVNRARPVTFKLYTKDI